MKYTSSFNGKNVFFFCDDKLKDTAEFFLTILQNEDTAYQIISEGNNIQIGWGFFKVLQADCGYQIVAYDLLKNPFNDVTEDLTLNLEIFAQQRKVLNDTKSVVEETSFQDTLIVHKEAFEASQIYLQRSEPEDENDSGWYMGVIDGEDSDNPDDYEKICTYQLIKHCKEALSVMQLPVGTICIFENGELIEAVDEDDNKIL